ncbi:hypothetical protein IC229_21695 [Spirosoma sp. BT702]|uniref:Uncharacterized protein n=1 Tax=Spirosoma profusum TaxID=2771354 RepID=A0A927AP51_9BACT|nr:hypothetical protein [Spirosoma profusum]MBD2703274.1 hypothetical protein [Spirosoma profusum]
MQRRSFPLILLYGFGLALALSLAFNAFLLYEKSRHLSVYEDEFGNAVRPIDTTVWRQQLSDCQRDNQLKDSLIRRYEPVPNAPPNQQVLVQHPPAKQ